MSTVKWVFGLVFAAGIAYATLNTTSAKVKEHDEHLARHDAEFAELKEDMAYMRSGIDLLLGRRRHERAP